MTEPEGPRATLYDFLYIDHERVKSLYARLFSGLPGAIESVASDAKTKTNTLKVGGAPFGGAEHRNSKQVLESRLERIDPHDLILRDVLEGLKEHNLIHTAPPKRPLRGGSRRSTAWSASCTSRRTSAFLT
jgi:hypothetical protein